MSECRPCRECGKPPTIPGVCDPCLFARRGAREALAAQEAFERSREAFNRGERGEAAELALLDLLAHLEGDPRVVRVAQREGLNAEHVRRALGPAAEWTGGALIACQARVTEQLFALAEARQRRREEQGGMDENDDGMLSSAELAEKLGVNRTLPASWAKRGAPHAKRPGKSPTGEQLRWDLTAVQRWREERRMAQASAPPAPKPKRKPRANPAPKKEPEPKPEPATDYECTSCGHPESVHDEEHMANLCPGFVDDGPRYPYPPATSRAHQAPEPQGPREHARAAVREARLAIATGLRALAAWVAS